jgi:hypothetical protein
LKVKKKKGGRGEKAGTANRTTEVYRSRAVARDVFSGFFLMGF